jgi:hypothetical protein
MSASEIAFLILVICAFGAFALVLGITDRRCQKASPSGLEGRQTQKNTPKAHHG